MNSGYDGNKVHLLGTDGNGRLCEVYINKLTIGWAFDRATNGAAQYADEWELLHYVGQSSGGVSRTYSYDVNTNIFSESFQRDDNIGPYNIFEIKFSLQLRPTYGRSLYDGKFIVERISRDSSGSQVEFAVKQVCNIQTLINDDTESNETKLILRTGIVTKY